ncbi:MAG: DHH family phosphoesterase [Lachnospiraceae bacterium]|nr:DHH family phosphoesterase [Lachnospiraceae bacterium]
MAEVYITGHRNPDLDSVCSAYAYGVLKNQLDSGNTYIPIRCGHLSGSTKKILKALNIIAPPYKGDVFPKVSDVMLQSDSKVDITEPLTSLAKNYDDANPSVIPVYDKGEFAGLVSVDDITAWFMKELSDHEKVNSVPLIKDVMREQEAPIQSEDLFEEAKISLSTSKKRGLSVFDGDNFVGFVTRRCFLKAPKYNVILVDHNEPKQSVKGIESANIIEIIDHHRLDSVKTTLPIFIDAEPLGSTCTIVCELFKRNGLVPDKETAKVLLVGICADTLVLKSPTTTATDIRVAGELADICGVDVKTFGHDMFSYMESLSNVDPEKAILSDFKRYSEKGSNIGIGQCEATTLHDIDTYKDKFLQALEDVRDKNGLDWAVVMITDVMSEHSILLSTKNHAAKYLPYNELEEGVMDMPGVLSRKKQLLPEIIFALGM